MSVINAVAQLLAAGGDYQISRSVRLRASASAYLNRTFPSAGNKNKWTYSGWFKIGIGTNFRFIGSNTTVFGVASALGELYLDGSNRLTFFQYTGGTTYTNVISTQVFRDPSAWYHIVCIYDDAQATASNRVRMFVNGSEITSFATASYPSQNFTGFINEPKPHVIGAYAASGGFYGDGYLTEVNFIDGQALTPSSFGETDSITGVWKPKKYAGTYGTNGFYLNFSDPSAATATTIGKDYSGNGNNWTPNNISVTAGATYDSMLDVPTLGGASSNYCVLNPLSNNQRGSMALSSGNLQWTNTSTSVSGGCPATMDANPIGKVYFEGVPTAIGQAGDCAIGLSQTTGNWATIGSAVNASLYDWAASGSYYNAGTTISAGVTFTANDVIMVCYDQATGKVWFGKNGTWNGSGDPAAGTNPAFTISDTTTGKLPFVMGYTSPVWQANFGQRPFAYTPPTGFKALNTQNLPDSTIKKGNAAFDTTIYTGTGATQSIVNSGAMQPDLVWIKSRSSGVRDHRLMDSMRGINNVLSSNLSSAEYAGSALSSINSNGFTLNTTDNQNLSAETYVGWQWKKGATQGFEIVTYTGTGANTTINHSLGVAPKMLIVKSRNGTSKSWNVWHAAIATTEYLLLESTAAKATDATKWNSTAPSSSVFSLGSAGGTNASGENFVAYLFSEVAGFSKFGSYTGNGSADGPFTYLGFRPRFVMIKRTDSTGNWQIIDTERVRYNEDNAALYPNLSNAEDLTNTKLDALSNGFKIRGTPSTDFNTSGSTYVFAAFAENPFKNSLAR